MADIVSDAKISEMIAERKTLPPDWMQQLNRFKDKDSRYEAQVDHIEGDAGTRFRIIVGISPVKMNVFSVVLIAVLPENPEFRLLRYDGSNHNHSNKIEDNRIGRKPHIHRATERYQRDERRLPHDGYAKQTDRYQDLPGAWNCFFSDVDLQYPEEHQLGMLPVQLPRFMGG